MEIVAQNVMLFFLIILRMVINLNNLSQLSKKLKWSSFTLTLKLMILLEDGIILLLRTKIIISWIVTSFYS